MATSLVKWMIAIGILCLPGHNAAIMTEIHPFYVSVTEINHNPKDKTLEISCKIFTNDFETTLKKAYNTKVDLNEPKDKIAADRMISGYIEKHLQVKVDGNMEALQFIGSEKQAEATWSYFQVNNVPIVKKIDIVNTILYEAFESEINIIHVTVSGNRKSLEITNPTSNASF